MANKRAAEAVSLVAMFNHSGRLVREETRNKIAVEIQSILITIDSIRPAGNVYRSKWTILLADEQESTTALLVGSTGKQEIQQFPR